MHGSSPKTIFNDLENLIVIDVFCFSKILLLHPVCTKNVEQAIGQPTKKYLEWYKHVIGC
jgi:hypothetical protein